MKDKLKITVTVVSLLTIVCGLFVIVGWLLDIVYLKSVFPGLVTMKFNTALAFILTGLSLLAWQKERPGNILGWLGRACSIVAVSIGLLTLLEYLFGINLGIDQFFFAEPAGAALTTHLGRMAPMTAINFVMLNSALLLLSSGQTRYQFWIQLLAALAGLAAYESLIAYLFGVKFLLFADSGFTAMALHTALLFFLLAIGLFASRSTFWATRLLCGSSSTSGMLRRLFPLALTLPVLFGWLKLTGERLGLVANELGVTLVALSNAIVLSLAIWFSARKAQKLEENQSALDQQWAITFDAMSDGVSIHNLDHEIVNANLALARLLGRERSQLIGQKCFHVFHCTDQPIADCPMEKTIVSRQFEHLELFEKSLNRWLAISTSPLFDRDGRLTRVIHVVRDITEQKEAEAKLKNNFEELERINKVMVGRELRMVELKAEIEKLKAKLKEGQAP